jgi:hypothetical protein
MDPHLEWHSVLFTCTQKPPGDSAGYGGLQSAPGAPTTDGPGLPVVVLGEDWTTRLRSSPVPSQGQTRRTVESTVIGLPFTNT